MSCDDIVVDALGVLNFEQLVFVLWVNLHKLEEREAAAQWTWVTGEPCTRDRVHTVLTTARARMRRFVLQAADYPGAA